MASEFARELQKEGSDFREVQTHGEVTIPKGLREKYGLGSGARVVVSCDDDVVTIRKIGND